MDAPLSTPEESMSIRTWSYSRLTVFEQCPLRAKLAWIDKIPEPERPLPPGKTEHANDRGTRIHTAAEIFVNAPKPVNLAPELKHFAEEFTHLRTLYQQKKVSLEGEWGMDKDWMPIGFSDPKVWLRLKLDAFVHLSPTEGVAIDFKTGKRFGNELKHGEQVQLYQLVSFLRFPDLQTITTELWYTDQDELSSMRFTRAQGLRFLANYERRGRAMTEATEFPAKPNQFNCKWCPYNTAEHCAKGIRADNPSVSQGPKRKFR